MKILLRFNRKAVLKITYVVVKYPFSCNIDGRWYYPVVRFLWMGFSGQEPDTQHHFTKAEFS